MGVRLVGRDFDCSCALQFSSSALARLKSSRLRREFSETVVVSSRKHGNAISGGNGGGVCASFPHRFFSCAGIYTTAHPSATNVCQLEESDSRRFASVSPFVDNIFLSAACYCARIYPANPNCGNVPIM